MPMVRLDGEIGWFFTRDEMIWNDKDINTMSGDKIDFFGDENRKLLDPGSYPVKNYKGE